MTSISATAVTMMGALRRELAQPSASDRVTRYYSESGGSYTGRRFDDLGGPGDSSDSRDVITPADLLALSTLSVPVPGTAAIALIDGSEASRIAELLGAIPPTLTMSDNKSEVDDVLAGVGADLYREVRSVRGMGWVRTHKLLARKRPHLFPVYDNVVWNALGRPDRLWAPLRECLVSGELTPLVRDVRANAVLATELSDLRVIDVAIWMNHQVSAR